MAAREENTADGRLTDSLKTEIILAFKDSPSLWNTLLAIYKDKQKRQRIRKYWQVVLECLWMN